MSSFDQRFPKSWNAEIGLDNDEQKKALEVLNSTIEDLNHNPVLNPYYMIQRMRVRLETALGLTFDTVLLPGETGQKVAHLFPVNNPSVHNHSAQYTYDNTFLKLFPRGLVIEFRWIKTYNMYHVHATIKQEELPNPVPVA